MPLAKPPNIANDPFKSAKWDELTAGRSFTTSDAPALALLCQWYKLAQQAMDELDNFGSQTAYQNDMGDLKAFPQIGTLKQCSNEIRQLNKQLGICDTHTEVDNADASANILSIISGKRSERSARTA
jgi:phage terminase small subunit